MSSPAAAVYSTDWFAQVLLGRWRGWGNLQLSHLFILVSFGCATLYVYLWVLNGRLRKYSEMKKLLPRWKLSLDTKTLSRTMYRAIIDEHARVDLIHERGDQFETTKNSSTYGDGGWGVLRDGAEYRMVHFSTTIAKSYEAIEKTAISRRPSLSLRNVRSVRDYYYPLKKAFPLLRSSLWNEYMKIYEKSVFGGHRVTNEEYEQFLKIFHAIIDIIHEKNNHSSTSAVPTQQITAAPTMHDLSRESSATNLNARVSIIR